MICYLTTATYFLYFFIVLYYTFFFQSITLAQSYLHVSIPHVDPFSFTSPYKVVVNSAGNALTFLNLMPNLSCGEHPINCSGCQLVHAPVSVLLFFFYSLVFKFTFITSVKSPLISSHFYFLRWILLLGKQCVPRLLEGTCVNSWNGNAQSFWNRKCFLKLK